MAKERLSIAQPYTCSTYDVALSGISIDMCALLLSKLFVEFVFEAECGGKSNKIDILMVGRFFIIFISSDFLSNPDHKLSTEP